MTSPNSPSLPTHILVPIDFSEHSDRAFAYAMQLASKLGARVSVLHVYQAPVYALPEGFVFAGPELETELSNHAQKQLDEWAKDWTGNKDRIQTILLKGAAAQEITACAKSNSADLIVMGTHGRSGMSRLLLGSVAERVVRTSDVPVLTLPLHEDSEGTS